MISSSIERTGSAGYHQISPIAGSNSLPERWTIRTIRVGALLVVIASLLSLAQLCRSGRIELTLGFWSMLVNLGVGITGLCLSLSRRFEEIWRGSVWALVFALIVNATCVGIVGGHSSMLFISLIMVTIGTGALLQWSGGYQLTLNLVCLASGILARLGSIDDQATFELLGLVTSAALSQFICYSRSRYLGELHRSHVQIKDSEAGLRQIFDANPDSIMVVDVETRKVRDVNQEFVRKTGYARDFAIGKATNELGIWMNPKDREVFAERILADHYVRNVEIPIRKSDGTLLPCRVSSIMAQLNGRPSVLSFAHDISDLKRSELELLRNEEKFRRIFESSLDIIIVTEKATGKILEVNQEFMRLSGYPREEALGHTTFDLGLWADVEKCEKLFRELGDYRRVEGMELSFVARGGVVIPCLLSISPIKLDIGDCWLKVLRDISGVKETEARLRDSEATLRKIFDSNLDSMGILDVATNRYVSINEEFSRSTGYTREEIIGRTPVELGIWADPKDQQRFLDELLKKFEVRNMQTEFRIKDGTVTPCLLSGVIAELGGRQCCVTITRDISALVAAQEKLRTSEAMLREIFDSSVDNISVTDITDGIIIDVNNELARSLGFSKSEMIGKRFDEIDSWADPKHQRRFSRKLIHEGQVRNFATVFRSRDGDTFPALISAVVLELGGRRCALSIARDVTDLEAARQAALAASNAKSEFLSSMSHEIRTPMNAILGMADLMGESELNSEQRRYLDSILSNGNALLEIINSILDLAKVESGRLSLEASEFDIVELTERAAETLAVRAHEKHLELALRFEPDLRGRWIGDSLRLRQILINLIGNAIKFTERGEVIVSVGLNRDLSIPGNLLFEVSDTGIGIAQDKLGKIFSAFTQADSSTTRNFGGSGLGLAIVSRLTTLMGGRVWVESEMGSGSVFRFTIELSESSVGVESAANPDLHGLRAFIITPKPTSRKIISEILSSRGAESAGAASVPSALTALSRIEAENRKFGLLLIDADSVSPENIESIWRESSLGRAIPILVLMNSNGFTSKMKVMRELGLTYYVIKPVRRSELLALVATAIATKRPDQTDVKAPEQTAQNHSNEIGLERVTRVLLTDDSPDNRLLIAAYLKRGSYLIDEAQNGQVAIDRFMAASYDIVLMDIQMPVLDGYSAVRAIRQWEANNHRAPTPIIALTASALAEDVRRAKEAGCDMHVSKPVKKSTLLNAITSAVSAVHGPAPESMSSAIEIR
jgi:PAS domain S-box-containing protein